MDSLLFPFSLSTSALFRCSRHKAADPQGSRVAMENDDRVAAAEPARNKTGSPQHGPCGFASSLLLGMNATISLQVCRYEGHYQDTLGKRRHRGCGSMYCFSQRKYLAEIVLYGTGAGFISAAPRHQPP